MANPENLAIGGYDPVSYFTNDSPIQGNEQFHSEYEGRLYYFSSAENLASFTADPARYAPQYGGYCAVAMSEGSEVPVDPETYDLRDGRLYFFYNDGAGINTKDQWEGNESTLIEAADQKYNPAS